MKKSCHAMLLLLFLAFSLAIPARADEAEIERRFHDAYVLEVVEGKVADAAKVYLALMGEDDVPPRLQSESHFRFAICAVLLGRADEGRAHLQALIDDVQTPVTLRKRARTYLDSVATIEIGTEMEKKLQALLFDLGRIDPSMVQVPAYRDFEIIGKRSLPFLRRLLQHSDPNLRRHAFRLLVRMDEPGMSDLWTLEFGAWIGLEFGGYLKEHEPERRNFEKRVMEMGKPAWQIVRTMRLGSILSLEFVRAFAATKIAPGTAVAWLGYAQLPDEAFDQLVTWMDGEDVALADAAMDWLLRQGFTHAKADGAFYEKMFRRLMTRLADEKTRISQEGIGRFQQLTARMPAKTILDTLQFVLADVESHGGLLQDQRAAKVLLKPIAAAFDSQEATVEQADRYAALLMRWMEAGQKSDETLKKAQKSGTFLPPQSLARRLGHVCQLIEEPKARTIIQQVFAVPGRLHHSYWMEILPSAADPRGVRLIAVAIAAAPRDGQRSHVFHLLNGAPATPYSPALMEALDAARLRLMNELSAAELLRLLSNYEQIVGAYPMAQVQRQLLRLLTGARTLSERNRSIVLQEVFKGSSEYIEKILAPLAATQWETLDAVERLHMLNMALGLLTRRTGVRGGVERARDAAASILRPHLAEVEPAMLQRLASHRDRFPIESWLPLAPGLSPQWMRTQLGSIDSKEAERIFERMRAGSNETNYNVLLFMRRFTSPEVQRAVFDQLLVSERIEDRDDALQLLNAGGAPASPEALEALLALELAAKSVDLGRLHRAGYLLLQQRPSEKLFPVARVLLGSDNRHRVLSGISMANSLGRADLVPYLMPHLRSMDVQVRVAAKKTVAAIWALSDLQQQEPGAKK